MQATICDVGPRDGLQHEQAVPALSARAVLVKRLPAAGLPPVRAISFVHPGRAAAEGVVAGLQVERLVAAAAPRAPRVGVHLHDTSNTGFASADAALEAGASLCEASVGGPGGRPFAPRATGTVATEDLVYLLHREGVERGVDLDALIGVAAWLEEVLGRTLPGQVYRAGSFAPVAG